MGARVRILSANLLNGRADPDALAELVRRLGVDVAAVQELSPEQAEALAEVLPFGSLRPSRDYNGMGIALRAPARESRVSLPRRDALVAELGPEGWSELAAPVEIVNVHVTAPHTRPAGLQAFSERRGQLRGLLAHLEATHARTPQVVIGDFNATPLWPVYRRVARLRRDAARASAERNGARPRPTWGPGTRAPRVLRIDHAFVQALRVEAFRVERLPGSDHDAIVVDVVPD
jgi:endonuclease/exonuclease/phosphatase family metal-dependent hydrolase